MLQARCGLSPHAQVLTPKLRRSNATCLSDVSGDRMKWKKNCMPVPGLLTWDAVFFGFDNHALARPFLEQLAR